MAVTKRVRKVSDKNKVFFHAEVYVRGVRVLDKTFNTQAAAYVWHDREKEKILNGDISGLPDAKEATYGDCIKRYLDEGFPRLRVSSQQSMEARLPYFSESPFINVRMKDFNAQVVDEWLSWLLRHETRNNPSRKSFLHELKFMTVILTWYRNYCDPSFVVPIVKRHRERCHFKVVAPRRPDYYMRPDDVGRWITWLRDHRKDAVYWQIASFMILTGTRVSEAAGLCWDAIDLENSVARVIRRVRWDHWTRRPALEDCTKTEESIRLLPLAKEIVAMLWEMRRKSSGEGVIFHKDGSLLRYNAIQSAFNAGFKTLGLPWRSTHICRHTYGTLALLATRDLGAVQASLGHRSRSVTERYAKAVAMLSADTSEKTAALLQLSPQHHVQNHVLIPARD